MALSFIFCFFLCFLHGLHAKAYHVVLDPGHGGRDRGSTHDQVSEAQLNLRIALLLEKKIKKEKNLFVSLTRKTNKNLSLKERIQFIHKSKADFLISLHINSIHKAHIKGMEMYVASSPILKEQQISFLSPHNLHQLSIPSVNNTQITSLSKSTTLHHILQDLQIERRFQYSIQLSKSLYKQWHPNKKDRSIRQAPFFILTQSPIPSTLIELGFLSNPRERRLLQQRDYQEKVVAKIYQGILAFKKILDKG